MCLTCHIEDHLEGGINLLRDGPYIDRREICFKCHTEGEYAKINPHVMLDKSFSYGKSKVLRRAFSENTVDGYEKVHGKTGTAVACNPPPGAPRAHHLLNMPQSSSKGCHLLHIFRQWSGCAAQASLASDRYLYCMPQYQITSPSDVFLTRYFKVLDAHGFNTRSRETSFATANYGIALFFSVYVEMRVSTLCRFICLPAHRLPNGLLTCRMPTRILMR
jgi:hypothetical protein